MRIFRFDHEVAHPVKQFDSANVAVGRGVRTDGKTQVTVIHVEPGGTLGFHPSTGRQLYMVMNGDGWVEGPEREPRPIHAGQAAFWDAGEWHASGSDTGMTAVSVEADEMNPAEFMPEVE